MATVDVVILLSIQDADLPPVQVQANKTKGEQGVLVLPEECQTLLYRFAQSLTNATVRQIPSVQALMAEAEETGGDG